MKSLTKSIQVLVELVTQDPQMESAWLTALAHLEHLAAEQVLGNITQSTPQEYMNEIKAHAADEARHRDTILKIRPFPETLNGDYQDLRRRLCAIAESFIKGYFATAVLSTARSRFVAYVHGAIIIEQFPFQIYSAYIQETKDARIRQAMQSVLDDEVGHIQLGKKFWQQLPEDKRLSLTELQIIEKEMCMMMVERMTEIISRFKNRDAFFLPSSKASTRLTWMLGDRPWATLAWIHVLGKSEEIAAQHMQRIFKIRNLPLPPEMPGHVEDEIRHAKLLQRSVLLQRRSWLTKSSYKEAEFAMSRLLEKYLVLFFSSIMKNFKDPHSIYLYGAWGLEMRVFKHYTEIMKWTDDIGVAHAISGILVDETEHTHMVHTSLNEKNILNPEALKWVRQLEEDLFENACKEALDLILQFDEKPDFAPPYQHTFHAVPQMLPTTTESATMELN
ncbi:ferritin-like domain-containing protein [Bdellovibrio sp. HCB-162]|uniref:ferritin-like domain-containing protein n=1 Tax=Bdellovibrio sp. HCB-162 TaxID=3394234 RepID=UPI0039BD8C80